MKPVRPGHETKARDRAKGVQSGRDGCERVGEPVAVRCQVGAHLVQGGGDLVEVRARIAGWTCAGDSGEGVLQLGAGRAERSDRVG